MMKVLSLAAGSDLEIRKPEHNTHDLNKHRKTYQYLKFHRTSLEDNRGNYKMQPIKFILWF